MAVSHAEYRRISQLFEEVCELPEEAREARLADPLLDPDIVSQVRALLSYADPQRRGALDRHEFGAAVREFAEEVASVPPERLAPKSVGDYEILEEIGVGGMGVVYAARHPKTQAEVALKLIRPGIDSKRVLDRFRRESEVLRLLDDPGIARFIDAGEGRIVGSDGRTSSPRPFLVMERIRGLPIVEYARTRQLSLEQRLELMARIAEALDHAHEAGVVHRDLKPANLLIESTDDPIGNPRILDFGVALASNEALETLTRTETGVLLGTLGYMSPEQLDTAAERVDRRSDVYSLGVLLFELLCARLPHDLHGLPLAQAALRIQQSEPTRLSAVDPTLRGRIELIVDTALERDLRFRYASAKQFADDIRSYLNDAPLRARRPTFVRRTMRLVRQHRLLFAVLFATIASLALGLTFAVSFALAEGEQRLRAEANEERADRNAEAAQRHAEEARERTREAEEEAYRASLLALEGQLREGYVAQGLALLEGLPERMRGWEWDHFKARFDGSVATTRLDVKASIFEPQIGFEAGAQSICIGAWVGEKATQVFRWELAAASPVCLASWPQRLPFSLDALKSAFWIHDGTQLVRFDLQRGTTASYADPTGCSHLWATADPDVVVLHTQHQLLRWNVRTGDRHLLTELPIGDPRIELDPSGCWLIAVTREGTMLLSVSGAEAPRSIADLGSESRTLVVAPHGKRVAATKGRGAWALQYQLQGERFEAAPTLLGAPGPKSALEYSPDGEQVAIANAHGGIRLVDSATGEPRAQWLGHLTAVEDLCFAPADGGLLASVDSHGLLRLWSAPALPERKRFDRGSSFVRFVRDSQFFFTASPFGPLRIFEAPSAEPRVRLNTEGMWIRDLDLHPRLPLLALAVTGNHLTASRILICDYDGDDPPRVLHEGERGGEWKAAFSPDGSLFAAQSTRGGLLLWNRADWKLLAQREPIAGHHSREVPLLRWIDNERLVIRGPNDCLLILAASDLRELQRLEGHRARVEDVDYHAGTDLLASASIDRSIRIWDLKSKATPLVLTGHASYVTKVAFSPDGKRLASSSADLSIRLWRCDGFRECCQLLGTAQMIGALAWSPDGSALVSETVDAEAHLWDTLSTSTRRRLEQAIGQRWVDARTHEGAGSPPRESDAKQDADRPMEAAPDPVRFGYRDALALERWWRRKMLPN